MKNVGKYVGYLTLPDSGQPSRRPSTMNPSERTAVFAAITAW